MKTAYYMLKRGLVRLQCAYWKRRAIKAYLKIDPYLSPREVSDGLDEDFKRWWAESQPR